MIVTGLFDNFLEKRFIVWSKSGKRFWESSSQKKTKDQTSSLKRTKHQKKIDLAGERSFQSPNPIQEETYQMPPEMEASFWLGGPCLHTHR